MSDVSVNAFMITRADTAERLNMLRHTITDALAMAGMDFDLTVHTLTEEARKVVNEIEEISYVNWDDNVGQHVITNQEIERADTEGADFLLRLDDDVKFLSKRWLYKMVEAATTLGDKFIISPTVTGLNNPPERTEVVEVEGIKVAFLTEAIGGICRLHNMETLCNPEHPYRADIRQPLGFGDATGIGRYCQANSIYMVYLDNVRVKHRHGTAGQVEKDPIYHAMHDVFQHIPYIPVWHADD